MADSGKRRQRANYRAAILGKTVTVSLLGELMHN
jgi:hypothetical protein